MTPSHTTTMNFEVQPQHIVSRGSWAVYRSLAVWIRRNLPTAAARDKASRFTSSRCAGYQQFPGSSHNTHHTVLQVLVFTGPLKHLKLIHYHVLFIPAQDRLSISACYSQQPAFIFCFPYQSASFHLRLLQQNKQTAKSSQRIKPYVPSPTSSHHTFLSCRQRRRMVNATATISSFSIASIVILGMVIMACWNHCRSRIAGLRDAEVATTIKNTTVDGTEMSEEEGSTQRQPIRGWRWKRILRRVGWIQVPSAEENDEERRYMGRRGAIGSENGSVDVVSEQPAQVADDEADGRPKTATNILPRPTYVRAFENLGGYRYGGDDYMAALPISTSSTSSPTPYSYSHCFAQNVAELEDSLTHMSTYSPRCSKDNSNGSINSNHGDHYSLTSHNGFPSARQDDRRPCFWPVGEVKRGSLVPAPLDPGKKRYSPYSGRVGDENNKKQIPQDEMEQDDVEDYESPAAAHSRRASAFGSASVADSVSRYSHFENPLGQHPPELTPEVRESTHLPRRSSVPIPGCAVGTSAAAYAMENQRPVTARRGDSILPPSLQVWTQPAIAPVHSISREPRPKTAPHPPFPAARQPTAGPHQHHRHFSVCDDIWVTVPLTPAKRSHREVKRWSWTVEDPKIVGVAVEGGDVL